MCIFILKRNATSCAPEIHTRLHCHGKSLVVYEILGLPEWTLGLCKIIAGIKDGTGDTLCGLTTSALNSCWWNIAPHPSQACNSKNLTATKHFLPFYTQAATNDYHQAWCMHKYIYMYPASKNCKKTCIGYAMPNHCRYSCVEALWVIPLLNWPTHKSSHIMMYHINMLFDRFGCVWFSNQILFQWMLIIQTL